MPTSTGAAKAIGLALPGADGRPAGLSPRVPVPVGSVTGLTAYRGHPATVEEIDERFAEAAAGPLSAGASRRTDAPLVSTDIVGGPASRVFDSRPATVTGRGRQVKVFGWYGNEPGLSHRVVDVVRVPGTQA